MDLRQLTALVTVAETGSVTAAARALHLVQPSVTRQVRLLEEELGVRLFERTRQGMTPTAAGELMVGRARRALAELERGRAEVRPHPRGLTGIVTLGLLDSVVDVVAGPVLAAVQADHPGVELRLVTAYSGHLQAWLDDGEVDCTLLYDLTGAPGPSVVPVLSERLWAVAPPGAGLSPQEPTTWAEVLARPLVLPVAGHGLRVMMDAALAALPTGPGRRGDVVAEVNSMRLQVRLVAQGRGWTVLPAVGVADQVAAGVVSGAPIAGPGAERSIVIGTVRGRRTPPAVEAVAAALRGVCIDAVAQGRWPDAVADSQHPIDVLR